MTKVIIYNLKKCFEDGITFKDLAEFEQQVQDDFISIFIKSSFASVKRKGNYEIQLKWLKNKSTNVYKIDARTPTTLWQFWTRERSLWPMNDFNTFCSKSLENPTQG